MTRAEPKPSACSAHHCSTHCSCDGGSAPEPGNVVSSQLACGAAGGGEGFPTPQKIVTPVWVGAAYSQKRVWTVMLLLSSRVFGAPGVVEVTGAKLWRQGSVDRCATACGRP